MKHFTACLLIILTAAALINPVGHNRADHITMWIVQGAAAFAAITVLCFYLRLYYKEDIKPPNPRKIDDITQVPETEARKLQWQASRIPMNAIQARILALAILEPGELRQRVIEQYRPNERTLHQEVKVEAEIPMELLLPGIDAAQSNAAGEPAGDKEYPEQCSCRDRCTISGPCAT